MARNKLVDMIGKLSEEQVERLSGIAMEYLDLNAELENTTPKSCPCCGDSDAHFIKRGFSGFHIILVQLKVSRSIIQCGFIQYISCSLLISPLKEILPHLIPDPLPLKC